MTMWVKLDKHYDKNPAVINHSISPLISILRGLPGDRYAYQRKGNDHLGRRSLTWR